MMNGNSYTISAISPTSASIYATCFQQNREEFLVRSYVTVEHSVSTGCPYFFSQFNPMTASNFDRLQCIDQFSYPVDTSARDINLFDIPTVTFFSSHTKTDLAPVVYQPLPINE